MTQALNLRDKFKYSYSTGQVFRKLKTGWVACKSKANQKGYLRVGLDGRRVYAHRLVWALVTGKWPDGDVDHKNGIKSDNRLVNLRHVDRSTNLENMRSAKSNNKSTGLLGAYRHSSGRFTSRIQIKGADVYLGMFDTAELAHQAYVKAKRELHEGGTI